MPKKHPKPPDYWRPDSATSLFKEDADFRAWVVQWDRDKQIPFPLPDWLTERSEEDKTLLGPARCCQWVFACHGMCFNNFYSFGDQRYPLSGKFPALEHRNDDTAVRPGWWWRMLERAPTQALLDLYARAHVCPQGAWLYPDYGCYSPNIQTRVGAMLWLMDWWNPELDFDPFVRELKRYHEETVR